MRPRRFQGLGRGASLPRRQNFSAAEEPIGLTEPTRAISEPRQIHSALQPEPHDFDPFVPIGIRIGNFLIFPEAEFGVDMTNNVLATRFDRQSDFGPEVTPKIRIDADWARHFLSFEANARPHLVERFPDFRREELLIPAQGPAGRDAPHQALWRGREIACPGGAELDWHYRHFGAGKRNRAGGARHGRH
jgi:hypothetical protein